MGRGIKGGVGGRSSMKEQPGTQTGRGAGESHRGNALHEITNSLTTTRNRLSCVCKEIENVYVHLFQDQRKNYGEIL